MDYSKEGCYQSYCSMNNVLIKFFRFSKGKVKTNVDFSYQKEYLKRLKSGVFSMQMSDVQHLFSPRAVPIFTIASWSNGLT